MSTGLGTHERERTIDGSGWCTVHKQCVCGGGGGGRSSKSEGWAWPEYYLLGEGGVEVQGEGVVGEQGPSALQGHLHSGGQGQATGHNQWGAVLQAGLAPGSKRRHVATTLQKQQG